MGSLGPFTWAAIYVYTHVGAHLDCGSERSGTVGGSNFFLHFTFFSKKYMVRTFFSKIIYLAPGGGGRDLPSCPVAFRGAWYCSACYRRGPRRQGSNPFWKIYNFFVWTRMKIKLYTKIVAPSEFMQKKLHFFNINWKLRSRYENWDLDSISII
jgi:hypothetical protein